MQCSLHIMAVTLSNQNSNRGRFPVCGGSQELENMIERSRSRGGIGGGFVSGGME